MPPNPATPPGNGYIRATDFFNALDIREEKQNKAREAMEARISSQIKEIKDCIPNMAVVNRNSQDIKEIEGDIDSLRENDIKPINIRIDNINSKTNWFGGINATLTLLVGAVISAVKGN